MCAPFATCPKGNLIHDILGISVPQLEAHSLEHYINICFHYVIYVIRWPVLSVNYGKYGIKLVGSDKALKCLSQQLGNLVKETLTVLHNCKKGQI